MQDTSFRCHQSVIEFLRGDIVEQDVDAIVNAANSTLLGGGGVDGAIHRGAGPALLESCRMVAATLPSKRLPTGQAVITPGFALKARHVIHCVGPIYDRMQSEAPALLASCYREALALCRKHSLTSVAFPSISTGVYGYPVGKAAAVALSTLHEWLRAPGSPTLVRFVLFDDVSLSTYLGAANGVFV